MYAKAALLSLALPAYGAIHEALTAVPLGWAEAGMPVSDSQSIKLSVAL